MPAPTTILSYLAEASNALWPLAVAWHAVLLAGLVLLVGGWRPTRRTAGLLLTAPLLSVSAVAWDFGNPFNGLVFLGLAVATGILALRLDRTPIRFEGRPAWTVFAGTFLVAFGLVYPHFVQVGSPLAWLVAAPTGLIPCPTLSVVLGVLLLTRGLSRPIEVILGLAGLFYGVIGVIVLGVTLDLGLLLGSLALLAQAVLHPPRVPAAA